MYKLIIPIILIILVLLVLAKNIVIVQQSRAYVVERLGAFQAVWGVGIHLKIPFIERVARKVSLKEQIADFPLSRSSPRTTSPSRWTPSCSSRSPTPSCMPMVWNTPWLPLKT